MTRRQLCIVVPCSLPTQTALRGVMWGDVVCSLRYTEVKRAITPGYMWLWLTKPIRLPKGQLIELI